MCEKAKTTLSHNVSPEDMKEMNERKWMNGYKKADNKTKTKNQQQKSKAHRLKALRETKYSSKTKQSKPKTWENIWKQNNFKAKSLAKREGRKDFVVHFRGKNKKKRDIMNYGFWGFLLLLLLLGFFRILWLSLSHSGAMIDCVAEARCLWQQSTDTGKVRIFPRRFCCCSLI